MALKSQSKLQDLFIYLVILVVFIGAMLALASGYRWFSSATMPQQIISPRAGIECLVVSGSDGVGVSCYAIPAVKT